MPIMPTSEIIQYLLCVYCGADALTLKDGGVYCQSCGYQFPNVNGILDCRIPSDTALADPDDVAGHPIPKHLRVRQLTIGHDLRKAKFARAAKLLRQVVPDLEHRTFFFMGTGNGNDIRYLLGELSFNKAIGFDISPKGLIEHRQYAEQHLNNISIGLVLASNRLVPVKKMGNTLGLAISTLHHSGDQNWQIMKMLERNFNYLLVMDGRSTPTIRLLERLGLATKPEGPAKSMKPTTLDLAKLKATLQNEGFAYRYQTYFYPPLHFIPEFLSRSLWRRRLVRLGVDLVRLVGRFIGIDKYIDIVVYPESEDRGESPIEECSA